MILRRVLPLAVGCTLFAACGSVRTQQPTLDSGTAARVSASAVDLPATARQVEIPAPLGSDDIRTPIQRYIGVPADPPAAEEWSWRRVQSHVDTCMTERGWQFTQQPFEFRSTTSENGGFVHSLSEEARARYVVDRWGTPGHPNGSCEDVASRSTYVMNALPIEYQQLQDVQQADPVIVAARDRLEACLGGADPKSLTEAIRDDCLASTGYQAALKDVNERAETAFVSQYSAQLDLLKSELP